MLPAMPGPPSTPPPPPPPFLIAVTAALLGAIVQPLPCHTAAPRLVASTAGQPELL